MCLCLPMRIHKSVVFVLETGNTGLQGCGDFLGMTFILDVAETCCLLRLPLATTVLKILFIKICSESQQA